MEKGIISKRKRLDILLNPWVIFSGIVFGIYIGIRHKMLAGTIAPVGDIYLALLQMCVLPIMIAAIVSSIGRMLTGGQAGRYIVRLVFVFLAGLILSGVFGAAMGLIAKPGYGIDRDDQVTMGRTIYEAEVYSTERELHSSHLLDFIKKMVPTNIFYSISQGHNLSVLFFSVVLGISLGLLRSGSSNTTLSVVDSLYDAFLKIIGWVMYGLPLGLLCLMADQMSRVGYFMILAMLKLIILLYSASLALFVVYSIIIWLKVRGSYIRSVMAIKETLMVAIGTSSSFASIPSALRGLHNNLNLEKQTTNLVVPLGINLNPHGSVLHFVIATIFISQIYGVNFGFRETVFTVFGAVLASLAASGSPGIVALTMLSIVFDPLGLPSKVAVILLAAIDPIVDPIITGVNVYGNCASTVLIANRNEEGHH